MSVQFCLETQRPLQMPVFRCVVTFALVVIAISLSVVGASADELEDSELLSRIHMLPVGEDFHHRVFGKRTSVAQTRFDTWHRYEDKYLSFFYPEDSRVTLEIKNPEDRIPVDGSPIGTTENSFFRCYRLTFEGETYCLLLLDRKNRFDDGVCFCGHVKYDKYLSHHDALYRFSLLANGRIKKAQTLGSGLRVVLFERTHLPMHESVYARIALSIRFRQPPGDLGALEARTQQTYGKVGFLEKGMGRDAVIALLGLPTHEDEKTLKFVSQRSYEEPPGSLTEEIAWTIPLDEGEFLGLPVDWMERRWLSPEEGSVHWVLAKLDGYRGEMYSVDPATEEELEPLLQRVVELLPVVGERHWWEVCKAASLLAKRGAKDARVVETITKRFLEPQLYADSATDVLKSYGHGISHDLLVERIQMELALAREAERPPEQKPFIFGWEGLEELIALLGPELPKRKSLILEAMYHPHAEVRMAGYDCCRLLSESTARSCLVKGVMDPSPAIRIECVWSLAHNFESPETLELLRIHRTKEDDESVIEAFDEAIGDME